MSKESMVDISVRRTKFRLPLTGAGMIILGDEEILREPIVNIEFDG
jgi:hypothetical protein